MSFVDQKGLSFGQLAGCAAYFIVGGVAVAYFWLNAALGDCPAQNENCMSDATRALMFYGAPVIVLLGGVLLVRHMMRDKD